MRALLCIPLAMLLVVSAMHDASAKGRRQNQDAKNSENSEKKKAVDAAYQKALQRIPDSNEKPDPWKAVRSH